MFGEGRSKEHLKAHLGCISIEHSSGQERNTFPSGSIDCLIVPRGISASSSSLDHASQMYLGTRARYSFWKSVEGLNSRSPASS